MMGQEKRKTSSAEEETENLLKSLHLDAAAASEMLWEFSHPPLTEEVESTTGDSTYDIGSCEHLFIDSEELDEIARGLKAAHKPPTCVHDPCSGAAGIMACTECPSTFCTGEKGDRENPQGHAAWHASNDQHWVALWCDEPSKGYCFECGLTLVLGQNKVNEDDYALVPRNKKEERGTVSSYVEALPELSHPPSPEDGESTTGDSTYDIGSCQHLFSDSEQLDKMARHFKAAHKPPTCEHDPCSGAAGMMACTECPYTFCTGEKGDRENPQGHARWHASTFQHWVALWCDEPSKGYCFQCGLALMLGQNNVNQDDHVPRNKKDEWGTVGSYTEDDWKRLLRSVKIDWEKVRNDAIDRGLVGDWWGMVDSNAMDLF